MSLSDRWTDILDALRREGRYRTLSLPAGIDFTSNDYLGYGKLPFDFAEVIGPESASTSGTASRLLRGHHAVWEEVERSLAQWHGSEAVLMFTSGYTANEGLLSAVIESHDWAASDEYNHASIIDGLRLSKAQRFIFHHNDVNHLETGLRQAAKNRSANQELFIVTESLFSMEGDAAPLADLVDLAARFGANLIVDEAHATGCFNANGSGVVDQAGLRDRVLATVHTGGKALGLVGAYVCCSQPLKELLINRCRHFIYTTALPPIVGEWWTKRIKQIANETSLRKRLHDNSELFRCQLQRHGIHAVGEHYIVPIVIGSDADAVHAAWRLQEHGYDVRAIRPPTVPAGTSRLRVSIHADHDAQTLGNLVESMTKIDPLGKFHDASFADEQ